MECNKVFGYHSVQSMTEEFGDGMYKKGCFMHTKERVATWLWNIAQGLSYFPLLGIISGIFHLAVGIYLKINSEHERDSGNAEIAKGAFLIGTLGCGGILLTIPDVYFSAKRHYEYSRAST